jgi:hypothetical protein
MENVSPNSGKKSHGRTPRPRRYGVMQFAFVNPVGAIAGSSFDFRLPGDFRLEAFKL